jgi:hypothetical protein
MSQANLRKRIVMLTRVQRKLNERLRSITIEIASLSAQLKSQQIAEFESSGRITHLTMAGTIRKRPTSDPDAIYINHFKSLNPEDQHALLARLTGTKLNFG